MSELMAQAEAIAMLDKELDVQAALIEKLTDTVSYLTEAVLQLERTRVVRRSSKQKDGASQAQPPRPSLPGEYSAT